jgi:hypothetical protein
MYNALMESETLYPQENTSASQSAKPSPMLAQFLGNALYSCGAPYRALVGATTSVISPVLHQMTERFVEESITRNQAEHNPRLQKLLKFEIERRAYGPGQTQDVAEPVIWQTAKIGMALTLPMVSKAIEQQLDNGKWNHAPINILSQGAAAAIVFKESIEFVRLGNRFIAGLQGSEKMALDREEAIRATGVDPFSSAVTSDKPKSAITNATHQETVRTASASKEI